MRSRGMPFLYHFFHVVMRPLFEACFKFEIIGAENVPDKGGVLFMSNHASFIDPVIMGRAVKRNLHFMARSTLFKPGLVDRFLRSLNAFPVNRGAPDRRSIRRALEVLSDGELLLIFAEGSRTFDGTLGKAQTGVGFIAHKTEAVVIPVFLGGTMDVLPRGAKWPKIAKITVAIGKPLDMENYRADKGSREIYNKIGEDAMAGIAEQRSKIMDL